MRKIGIILASAVVMVLGFGSAAFATGNSPFDDHKHAICHATGSSSNPYVLIEPAKAGVFNGHLGQGHQNGEDIIPPFEYKGVTYSQNWDAAGQAIFNNGCKLPSTGTTTVTTTGPVSTTPTTTVTLPGSTVTQPGQTVTTPGSTTTISGPVQVVTITKVVVKKVPVFKTKIKYKTKVKIKKVFVKRCPPVPAKPKAKPKHPKVGLPYTR